MLIIINYHYIRKDFTSKFRSIFGVTPDLFEQQLISLKSQGDYISANDLIINSDKILNSKNKYFFVTFDDGLKEQYKFALPILEKLRIPAMFFANSRNFQDKKVSTVHKIHLLRSIISTKDFTKILNNQGQSFLLSKSDLIKAKSTYVYDNPEDASLKYLLNFKINFSLQEKLIKNIFNIYFDECEILNNLYMSENEIVDLSKRNFLGSHTHNHYPIGLLSQTEIEFELKNSKLFFEKITQSTISMVSYPYGTPDACNAEVANNAKSVGYKFGFTTTRGSNNKNNNKLLLNRYDCNDLSDVNIISEEL
ncbi:polysaccharide deacetylase family protein [Flavobacterium sp. P4023]|uniref:Polysaccharide deacetylase family protein n=1 Tax=Flavobacterium flabelliforme TaxID=2816119 RepID=A0ABS5CPH2_9FLAO|nr:polysaccharide deacetylase family protein [Flavobacterium flabelliforme]MBP4140508.1 polysaccharide deacetylase family protein [Flavobacterium flabelliforme]